MSIVANIPTIVILVIVKKAVKFVYKPKEYKEDEDKETKTTSTL